MGQPAILPVHTAVPGRARFSVAGLKRNDRIRRALEAGLAGRGIRSVTASTSTGTVLVLFETGHDLVEIARRLSEAAASASGAETEFASHARPPWHEMDAEKVLDAVSSHSLGLSQAEARKRLAETGANAIPPIPGRTQLEILVSQFQSMPIALLAAGAVLSVATGGLLDAAIILGVIGLNGAIGFIVEARAEETIGSLRESRPPVARVLRDGKECEMAADALVPGDVIELRRDDLVPADARVIAANRLTVNEAVLTGESVPTGKAADALGVAIGADRRPSRYGVPRNRRYRRVGSCGCHCDRPRYANSGASNIFWVPKIGRRHGCSVNSTGLDASWCSDQAQRAGCLPSSG